VGVQKKRKETSPCPLYKRFKRSSLKYIFDNFIFRGNFGPLECTSLFTFFVVEQGRRGLNLKF